MARAVGDEEDGQQAAESQPFLDDDSREGADGAPALPSSPPQGLSNSRRTRSARPFGVCSLSIFILFVVITALGLSGLVLSFTPKSNHSPSESHPSPPVDEIQHVDPEDGHHHEDPAQGKPDGGSDTPSIVHYHEDVPEQASLRDPSQYILSPSWDRNAPPTTREYHWTISDADLNPDGIYRPMILINNQFPGPLVECNEGDTIIVRLENKATNATSIHFHGLFQNGTNFMDGTVGVTQCPIAPASNFTYQFDVRGQAGTYWYHAHHSAQASDGLLGPVVVHSKDELTLQELDYATDRVIMIQDHYHNTTSELLMYYLASDMENDEPVPDNALINGRGSRNCDDFKGWRCDSSNTSSTVLDLAAGQRHRLRFINVGAFAEFQIELDEHPFYITEVDGTDVHPEPFHRLNIQPAQRYSIVVETNVTTADTFWLRARMFTHCFTTENERLEPEIRAVVRYISPHTKALTSDPHSKQWDDVIEVICRDLNTSALHPVEHVKPPPADDFIALRANFMIGAWRLARGFFNGSTWHANATHPSLHRFLDSGEDVRTFDSPLAINDKAFERDDDFVMQTKDVRTIDISINNFDDGSHPFHLHGHKFFVMYQAKSGYPPTEENFEQFMKDHGGMPENPLRRDTITVEGYSWAIIRVVLDNPGLWTFHCHNTWHSESGMVMQFLVQSEIVSKWKVDPEQRAMCQLDGVTSGMRPDDSLWFGNFGDRKNVL